MYISTQRIVNMQVVGDNAGSENGETRAIDVLLNAIGDRLTKKCSISNIHVTILVVLCQL